MNPVYANASLVILFFFGGILLTLVPGSSELALVAAFEFFHCARTEAGGVFPFCGVCFWGFDGGGHDLLDVGAFFSQRSLELSITVMVSEQARRVVDA